MRALILFAAILAVCSGIAVASLATGSLQFAVAAMVLGVMLTILTLSLTFVGWIVFLYASRWIKNSE